MCLAGCLEVDGSAGCMSVAKLPPFGRAGVGDDLPSFAFQKVVFQLVKGHLSGGKTRPFAETLTVRQLRGGGFFMGRIGLIGLMSRMRPCRRGPARHSFLLLLSLLLHSFHIPPLLLLSLLLYSFHIPPLLLLSLLLHSFHIPPLLLKTQNSTSNVSSSQPVSMSTPPPP